MTHTQQMPAASSHKVLWDQVHAQLQLMPMSNASSPEGALVAARICMLFRTAAAPSLQICILHLVFATFSHSLCILQTKKAEHSNAILYPDHTFTDWQEADTASWPIEQYILRRSAMHHPWQVRDDRLLFRGSNLTGNRHLATNFSATSEVALTRAQRSSSAVCVMQPCCLPALLDVGRRQPVQQYV